MVLRVGVFVERNVVREFVREHEQISAAIRVEVYPVVFVPATAAAHTAHGDGYGRDAVQSAGTVGRGP